MTERLSNKNPCNSCGADRQIGNPNRWECECSRCDKPNDWKNNCIKKLSEYETAEEEGRLMALLCKVGDVVYQLMVTDFLSGKLVYKIFESKVCRIIVDSYSICFCLETADENKYTSELTNDDFGETIFLTYEEAEKALKEMEGNH